LKILFLDQFADLGGAQRCLLDLLPAIRERGWEATVGAPGEGPLLGRAHELGARAEVIPCGPFASGRKGIRDLARFAAQLPVTVRAIRRILQSCGAVLLYVNGPRLVPAATLAAGRRPMVFHCHSRFPRATALVGRCLLHARSTVIGSCRDVLVPLERYVPAERMHVVYPGVGETNRTPPLRERLAIGMIARISPEKGHAEFLEAARIVAGEIEATFLVCGAPRFSDPSAAAYAGRVRQLAGGLPVEFTGWQDDVAAVLSRIDVLVVPSRADASPRVIPEAFAAGVPVVAFAVGGIPEMVTEGDTGLLVAPLDTGALARRILELLAWPPERRRDLAANARTRYEQLFTLGRYRARVLRILEGLQ